MEGDMNNAKVQEINYCSCYVLFISGTFLCYVSSPQFGGGAAVYSFCIAYGDMDNTKLKYTNCLYKAYSTEKAKCNSGKRE